MRPWPLPQLRQRFVQGNMLVLESTRISCQDGRLVVRADNRTALLKSFPSFDTSTTRIHPSSAPH